MCLTRALRRTKIEHPYSTATPKALLSPTATPSIGAIRLLPAGERPLDVDTDALTSSGRAAETCHAFPAHAAALLAVEVTAASALLAPVVPLNSCPPWQPP